MTPEQHIADLDAALAEEGEDVILRHPLSATEYNDCTCRAFVRGISAEQLQAGIKQDGSNVIISPTEIIENDWLGSPTVPLAQDPRVPTISDKIVIAGRTRKIEVSKPIYLQNTLIRIDMVVLG